MSAATRPALGYGTLPLRRVLVVQTGPLREVLCATPVFTALRREMPAAHLTALVRAPFAPLLERHPDLNAVIAYHRREERATIGQCMRFTAELRERQFDWALAVRASAGSAFALWQSGIPWRTCVWRSGGGQKPPWARFYHQHVRQDREGGFRHEADYNLDVLRGLGFKPDACACRVIPLAEDEEQAEVLLRQRGWDGAVPLAVLHAGDAAVELAAEVGNGIAERGFRVAVSARGAGCERAEAVSRAMGSPPVRLWGAAAPGTLAAAFARARLFVGTPGGAALLAGAVQIPVVTLGEHAGSNPRRFAPYNPPHRAVEAWCGSRAAATEGRGAPGPGALPRMALAAVDQLLAGEQSPSAAG